MHSSPESLAEFWGEASPKRRVIVVVGAKECEEGTRKILQSHYYSTEVVAFARSEEGPRQHHAGEVLLIQHILSRVLRAPRLPNYTAVSRGLA